MSLQGIRIGYRLRPQPRRNTNPSVPNGKWSALLYSNHDYYYQVQGNMHVSNHAWCDFIWTTKDIHIERIFTDQANVPQVTQFVPKLPLTGGRVSPTPIRICNS